MIIFILCLILAIIIAGGCGFLITYLYYRGKINVTQKIDKEIEEKNHQLQQERVGLEARKQELLSSINALKQQATESGEVFLQQELAIANQILNDKLKSLENKYSKAQQDYEKEYLSCLADFNAEWTTQQFNMLEEIKSLKVSLQDYSDKVNAAAEAAKREEEKQTKIDFYRCVLTPPDVEEIKLIRSITENLRNPEPINKVIWKVYYEKPYTDLVGRVVGSGVHCGIYKITNLNNQKCYVGQAVNISERWRQHIKRGIGAETPTRNKLYPAMMEFGVENFSFEIIEECDRSLLNSREDYWQEFYKAKEFGYSIK